MPRSIEDVCDELRRELNPPVGIRIEPHIFDSIIIGNDQWAFLVTREAIDDNLHVHYAREAIPTLLNVIDGVEQRIFSDNMLKRFRA